MGAVDVDATQWRPWRPWHVARHRLVLTQQGPPSQKAVAFAVEAMACNNDTSVLSQTLGALDASQLPLCRCAHCCLTLCKPATAQRCGRGNSCLLLAPKGARGAGGTGRTALLLLLLLLSVPFLLLLLLLLLPPLL
jgi:hypothetical protein